MGRSRDHCLGVISTVRWTTVHCLGNSKFAEQELVVLETRHSLVEKSSSFGENSIVWLTRVHRLGKTEQIGGQEFIVLGK